jgi:hypothetical protein
MEAGKTFPLIGFIQKYFIKGTSEKVQSQSAQASNIDGHFGPMIMLCDEPPKWLTDAKEEDKYYEQVQEWKNVLTAQERSRTILDTKKSVDGFSERSQKCMKSDDARCWGFCTNRARDKSHALSSRIFQLTVSVPKVEKEEYNYDAKVVLTSDAKEFIRMEQLLVVEVYTAIQVGTLRDIDMWLFDQISIRVFAILRVWNIIDQKKGDRSRQIIRTFVRHQTIIRAVTAARHVPGGVLYKKPYDPADVVHIGPYLVVTLEIIYKAFHVMIGEMINEDAANVYKAVCKMVGYDHTKTGFQNYIERGDKIPFRKEVVKDNEQQHQAQQQQHYERERWKINLDYITLQGKFDVLAKKVACYTDPQLDVLQIVKVFESMPGVMIHTVENKKYAVELKTTLDNIRDDLNERGNNPVEIAEQESALLLDCDMIAAAEHISEKNMLFICPRLIPILITDVMERAFNLATITSTHPRIKAIKGVVYDAYPDLYMVSVWNDNFVEKWIEAIDTRTPDADVKRRDGVALVCGEKLTQFEQETLFSIKLNANREDHDDVYEDVTDARSKDIRIIKDWELEAATRVALRHGTPLNEMVIYTDAKIKQLYDEYVAEHPEAGACVNQPYPIGIIKERKADQVKKNKTRQQMTNGKNIRISSDITDESFIHEQHIPVRARPKKRANVEQNIVIDLSLRQNTRRKND